MAGPYGGNPGAAAGGLGTGAAAGATPAGPAPNMQDLYMAMSAFLPAMKGQQQQAPQGGVVGQANAAQVLMGPPPAMPGMPQQAGYLMGPQHQG